MKKLILLCAFLILGTYSCKKETFEDIPGIQVENKEYTVVFESPNEMADWLNNELGRQEFKAKDFEGLFKRKKMPLCYSTVDLIAFLAQYGQSIPDVILTVPNDFFQDGNCNVAKWTAAVYQRDPLDGTADLSPMVPVEILWELDSDPAVNTGSSLILPFYTYTLNKQGDYVINDNCPGIFQPSCNGYHVLTVTMTFSDGSVYQRTGTAKAQINNVPGDIPECLLNASEYSGSDLNIFDFDCVCPIIFQEYQFLVDSGLEWDLNNDGKVNAADLNELLANFGC